MRFTFQRRNCNRVRDYLTMREKKYLYSSQNCLLNFPGQQHIFYWKTPQRTAKQSILVSIMKQKQVSMTAPEGHPEFLPSDRHAFSESYIIKQMLQYLPARVPSQAVVPHDSLKLLKTWRGFIYNLVK